MSVNNANDRAQEQEPFLSNVQDEKLIGGHSGSRSQHRLSQHYKWALHAVAITMYTAIFIFLNLRESRGRVTTSLHPIDNLDIEYVPWAYDDYIESPFAGKATPDLDRHWHDLLNTTTIRVTSEELVRSNQSSVKLPHGGYMAWLGVYHELHCIKMLRQWNYREHYHPGIDDEDATHWLIHADHCLDILRSAALCHGDTTLTTFGWADQTKPMLNTRRIDHKCIDWSALQVSIATRLVGEEELASMINPNL